MIYANHDFAENFKSATGRKDEFMKEQIMIDEIAKVLINNKNDVINLLRKHGINATFNDSPERILELTLAQFSQNQKFTNDFKDLVLHINKTNNFQNATASDVLANPDVQTGITSVISGIANKKAKKKAAKNKAAADQLRERIKLAQAKMEQPKKRGWVKWVIIGTVSAVIITAIIIIIKKRKSSEGSSSTSDSNAAPAVSSNSETTTE